MATETVDINTNNSTTIISDIAQSQLVSTRRCSSPLCDKPASSLKCPICIELGLEPAYFCSQECYKTNFGQHHKIHVNHRDKLKRKEYHQNFKVPDFPYTGSLRPSYVTPMRNVPQHINKPDYWATGTPISELNAQRKGALYVPVYTAQDIYGIRKACEFGRKILDMAGHLVKPGITTDEIDVMVHEACIENGCYPSPLNYHSFPKSCCTSVNEVICHGIPDCRELQNGDIVNIDITVYKDGYHGDLNETFLVGDVEQKYKDLIKVTYESMMKAIEHVKPGVMCRKFGEIIDDHVSQHNYGVVRTYCGHGIGSLFHCNPSIPHYRKNKGVGKIAKGMVFTIEPMVNMGSWKDKLWGFDNWTAATVDGKRSAQFEHTILVTDNGYDILTKRTENSVPFWWETENQNKHNNSNNSDDKAK